VAGLQQLVRWQWVSRMPNGQAKYTALDSLPGVQPGLQAMPSKPGGNITCLPSR
jgi:hypothetical protein